MATKLDNLKWKLYWARRNALYIYGIKHGLVRQYDDELIERLRHVYYGGIPASIWLLSHTICNGRCYDSALLMSFGMGDDDFKLVDADIDMIRLRPKFVDEQRELKKIGRNYEHYGNHCFVVRTDKDGNEWVYDTTLGLIVYKKLYYLIERPRITVENDKQTTIDYIEYQDIKNADINKDKYMLNIIMPNVECIASKENWGYAERLKAEIERFKEEIGYEALCMEIEEDMKAKGFKR